MATEDEFNDPNYIPTDTATTGDSPGGGSPAQTNNDTAQGQTAQPPAILQQNQDNITTPKLPEGGTATAIEQTPGGGEISDIYGHNIAAPTVVNAAGGNVVTAEKAKDAQAKNVTAVTVDPNDKNLQVDAAKGTLSAEAQVQAQQQNGLGTELKNTLSTFQDDLNNIGVDPRSTVQEQYAKLTDFTNGTPAWAMGAITKANQAMAARGLGNSSVAGGAIATAVLQAALPIAVQDAQVFQTMQLKTLDLKAQTTFLTAGYLSQLDMKNLDIRQQTAVTNAQSFLNMDLANLSNEQQAAVISSQNRLQTILSNQAAQNAAAQFNATGQMQVDQFNASQANSIAQFNASQTNSMQQFNAGQTNAVAQFNTSMLQDAWKFNVNNQTLIDQANVNYLRNINTQNTAAKNAANLVNSTNLVNISNTAMANGIQMLRDQTAFSFQSGENDKDRAQQTALLNLQNQQWFQRYDTQQQDSLWKSVGNFVAGAAGTYVNRGLTTGNWGFGGSSNAAGNGGQNASGTAFS